MAVMNLFIGVPQSKYSALAIVATVLVVSLTLLLGKEPIPFSQKLATVLLLFLISAPGILLTLFQLTCLVTGSGLSNQRWWCSAYAWIISIILIVYSIFMIVAAVMTLTSGQNVLKEIAVIDAEKFEASMKTAEVKAKEHFADAAKVPEEPVVHDPKDAKKPAESFTVAGGASEPAPVTAFEAPEGFSSCGAPF